MVTAAAALLLSACSQLGIPNVRWLAAELHLGAYAWMTGVDEWSDEIDMAGVTAFEATVDIEGLATIDDTVVCDFFLEAAAAYALALRFGNLISGLSGEYDAAGEGFNVPLECEYEAWAEFWWSFEFEVVDAPAIMDLTAALRASSDRAVDDDRRVHSIRVGPKGGAPLCCDPEDGDDLDVDYEETLVLAPGVYVFEVYAFPYIASNAFGGHTAASSWSYEAVFRVAP